MKILKFILILSLSFGVILLSSCRDECEDQICLNGGVCDEGICQCPDGYGGSNCETKLDGFNCFNGNCVYTEGNAQYPTIGACQASCSNNNDNNNNNTSGFNCQSGNCIQVNSNGQYSTLSACQNACTASSSTLTFKNNTFTTVSITFNNTTRNIVPNGTTTFTGTPNSVGNGTAKTSGVTSSGNQVGLLINWNLSNNFPASGDFIVNLNISSEYFFLRLQNNGSSVMNPIYVNYGLTTQSVDYVNVPNNGVIYNIGYYYAWMNTIVRGIRGNNYTYWNHGENFNLPFTNNQSATLINTYLLEGDQEK